MKLGFLSGSIADTEKAARLGFTGIELHTSAFGDAGRGPLDADKVADAKMVATRTGVEITALAHYDNIFNPPPEGAWAASYGHVFDAVETLGVRTVATMSGFDPARDWDGNLELWAERFGPVAEDAERRGLRVAFENWMCVGGKLPFKPCNMGGSPDTWDAWFSLVPSPALGIEFDPSHLFWQGIDHECALREYAPRVYHVHAKDTQMLPERRYRGGINGDYFQFRIPGYGDIDWTKFVSVLDEIGYAGGVAIEHEDPIYSGDRFDEGLARGWQILHPLIHPAGRGGAQ